MRSLMLVLLLTVPAAAWDFRNHRAVVELACEYAGHTTRLWLENALLAHPDPLARTTSLAAVWPDVDRPNWPESGSWHYINLPLAAPDFPPERLPHPGPEGQVVWALDSWRHAAAVDPEHRAEALAYLLHLVGDAHQPLHACTYFSSSFPLGDAGGSQQPVSCPPWHNLHAVWDSAGLPVETTTEEVVALMRSHAPPPQTAWDPVAWVRESHALAIQYGYPEGRLPVLDEAYLARVRSVSLDRLHAAAFRLARVLHDLGPEADVPF